MVVYVCVTSGRVLMRHVYMCRRDGRVKMGFVGGRESESGFERDGNGF